MEPTTFVLIAIVIVLAALLVIGSRRRRDASLTPVRLGPSWSPPEGGDSPSTGLPSVVDERVEFLSARTGVDPESVEAIVGAWDEHLAVLGFLSLPPSHRYRVYDPADPPVARSGADGRAGTDPERVAHDVAARTAIAETDARRVLDALLNEPEDDAGIA